MAKALPSAQDLGVVGVQPSLAVASYKGATGGEDDTARGLYAAGGQFAAVATHLEQAQEKFDELQAEDRFNQYQERLNQIANDPETGWKAAKGENALKPDFGRKYAERFEEERKRLVDGLESPGAKQRFSRLAASAAMRNRAALYEHSAQERIAYGAKVASDTVKGIEASIWQNFGNDDAFNADVARAESVIRKFATEQGASKETADLAVREMNSRMWTNRIEAAVANGDTRKAKEMMGKVTYDKLLTTADKEKLDAKIKPQIKLSEAQEKVDGIFSKLVAANPNAPFPALAVDAALRKEFADDPEGLRFARQEADYRAGKIQLQQRESNHANMAKVMQMLHVDKVSPMQIFKSDEFRAMDGDQQARLIQHVDALATSAASRAASASARAAAEEARGMARIERNGEYKLLYYQANPDVVLKMSDNEIAGKLALEMGPRNAQQLLTLKRHLEKPENLNRYVMDNATFKSIISDYGYKPELLTKTGKISDRERTQQQELTTIKREIDQILQSSKPKTREEAEKIMRDKLELKVRTSTGFFGFGATEVPRLALSTAGDKGKEVLANARITLDQVPPEVTARYVDYIRKNRRGFENRTDAQIRADLKDTLERAAAVFELNGPPELVQDLLMGKAK